MSRLPSLTARQILQALKRGGFVSSHQRGSHLYLENPATGHTTTVPMHPGELRRSLLKEIVKQAGLSEDEFHDLL